MKEAGQPLNAGKIAELSGLDPQRGRCSHEAIFMGAPARPGSSGLPDWRTRLLNFQPRTASSLAGIAAGHQPFQL